MSIHMKSLGNGWWLVTINGVQHKREGSFDQVAKWASKGLEGAVA